MQVGTIKGESRRFFSFQSGTCTLHMGTLPLDIVHSRIMLEFGLVTARKILAVSVRSSLACVLTAYSTLFQHIGLY